MSGSPAHAMGLVLLASLAQAQGSEPAPDGRGLLPSHRYAPALWLAQEEPFYPMLPHPFAFDGIDNNGNGRVDLADEEEVAAFGRPALDEPGGPEQHADALRWVFGRLLDIRTCAEQAEQKAAANNGGAPAPPDELKRCVEGEPGRNRVERQKQAASAAPAVRIGRVPLKDFEVCGPLWGTGPTRCGPPPVVFYGADRQLSAKDIGVDPRKLPRLYGIQYWMYYPWDAGHINDGEHVSIFYDPFNDYTTRNLKAVLGAGHEGHTSNNILVASTDDQAQTVSPRSLPRHMPFLVELGKHASAPDFNCNGRFDVGVDANVGAQGAWGSRDVMVSIDKKNFGPFKGWMSVDRDGSGLLVDEAIDSDPALKAEWQRACPEVTRGAELYDRVKDRGGPASGVAVVDHRYRLVAATVFAEIYEAVCTLWGGKPIAEGCELPTSDQSMGDPSAVLALLARHRADLWGEAAQPETVERCSDSPTKGCVSDASLAAMREWLRHPRKLRARRDVWSHGDFGRYHTDFKRHLFKQIGVGGSYWVENGVSKLGLIARLSGFRKLGIPDSSLDLSGSIEARNDPVLRRYGDRQWRLSNLMINYNAYRTSYQGFYFGASYNFSTPEYLAATVIGRESPDSKEPVVIRRSLSESVSLRVGAAVGIARGRSRLTLRAGVHGPITRFVVDGDLAHRSRVAAGVHAGAELVVGFRNEKHPLLR